MSTSWGNDLHSPRVSQAMEALGDESDMLRIASTLRDTLGTDLGRRAAELHALRQGRTPAQRNLGLEFVTRKGLEQASAPQVASYRAVFLKERFNGATFWDATCGVGSDSLALAATGARIVSSDLDPHLVGFAASNLEGKGHLPRICIADVYHPPLRADVALIDPDR